MPACLLASCFCLCWQVWKEYPLTVLLMPYQMALDSWAALPSLTSIHLSLNGSLISLTFLPAGQLWQGCRRCCWAMSLWLLAVCLRVGPS